MDKAEKLKQLGIRDALVNKPKKETKILYFQPRRKPHGKS